MKFPINTDSKIRSARAGYWIFGSGVALLILLYCRALWSLTAFAWTSDLYSYIVLVPFISVFLIWLRRDTLPAPAPEGSGFVAVLAVLGGVLLALGRALGPEPDGPALTAYVASLLVFLGALAAGSLGIATLKRVIFPIAFLVLMIPLPGSIAERLEFALQSGSAEVAYAIFRAVGTPVFLQDLTFQLPGISIEVAPECSGIRSTVALFITSLVAANLMLNSNWRRLILVATIVPFALLRNGFRVFVVGQLCVTKGPQMIDSYIHRRGGPYFFLLSLVPLLFVLIVLMRSERRRQNKI